MRKITRQEFEGGVIAQHDDNDYSESGWVCFQIDGKFHLARYSHCSCFGTFESLCGGGISDSFSEGTPSVEWSGTRAELISLAERKMDPAMPERQAVEGDCDYGHLVAVYADVLSWAQAPIV